MDNEPKRVLLVEDDPQHVEAIDAMLKRVPEFDFLILQCYKLEDGIKLLKNEDFDAILLDLGLPDSKGLNTFLEIHKEAPKLPTVIFTSLFDEEIAIKALESGAQEYLFKGEYDGQDLAKAITHSIARKEYQLS